MASSGSAEDDFQSRVAKIFGSLAFSRSSSSKTSTSSAPASRQQSGSVWTVSDADVEKREWKRDSYDRDEIRCASSFEELLRQQRISSTARKTLEGDLKDLDYGEDDQGEDCDDVWSIRASMGLDRTLDNEAEEDEFDKVALGKESDGEGLSMKGVCSKSPGGLTRDPRANHVAAKIRLKEDAIEANKLNTSAGQPSTCKDPQSEESSKPVPPKPILKRKKNSSDSEARTSKRVRFDCVSEEISKKPEDTCSASVSLKSVSHQSKSGVCVPDYLLNPSRYTRYSFDPSSELYEKSQTGDYMDTHKSVEESKTSESESLKKVSIIPRKRTKDVGEDSSNFGETNPVVAELVEEEDSASAAIDGDIDIEESENYTSFQRKSRQYCVKQSLDETEV